MNDRHKNKYFKKFPVIRPDVKWLRPGRCGGRKAVVLGKRWHESFNTHSSHSIQWSFHHARSCFRWLDCRDSPLIVDRLPLVNECGWSKISNARSPLRSQKESLSYLRSSNVLVGSWYDRGGYYSCARLKFRAKKRAL